MQVYYINSTNECISIKIAYIEVLKILLKIYIYTIAEKCFRRVI